MTEVIITRTFTDKQAYNKDDLGRIDVTERDKRRKIVKNKA